MKQFSVLLFLLYSISSFSQKSAGEIIWSENVQLEWINYKARPNRASSFKAQTASSISFEINYENNVITINIENTFIPNKSWTKVDEAGNLLNHERLHFDISELFARRLRQKILETKFRSTGKKLMNDIADLYQEAMQDLARYQREYDKQTDHSVVLEQQKEWEIKVQKELDELKTYKSSVISFEVL